MAKKFNCKKLLDEKAEEVRRITEQVRTQLECLPEAILRHRPAPDAWSALECLDHLNRTADLMLRRTEDAMQKITCPPVEVFRSRYFGEQMVQLMESPNKQRLSLNNIKPAAGQPTEVVFDRFYHHQRWLLRLIETAHSKDLNKGRINSLIGPLIRYRLGDTLRIVVAHEWRHLRQAEHALQTAPKVA